MPKIASDGGYLASPVMLAQTTLAPGDREEIIVAVGESPVALVGDNFGRVLELRPSGSDLGTGILPDKFAAIERISESEITVDQSFHMEDARNFWGFDPSWAINGNPPPQEESGW